MKLSLDIPDSVGVELDAIAVSQGFPNAKALVIHFLTETMKRTRVEAAAKKAVAASLVSAEADASGIE